MYKVPAMKHLDVSTGVGARSGLEDDLWTISAPSISHISRSTFYLTEILLDFVIWKEKSYCPSPPGKCISVDVHELIVYLRSTHSASISCVSSRRPWYIHVPWRATFVQHEDGCMQVYCVYWAYIDWWRQSTGARSEQHTHAHTLMMSTARGCCMEQVRMTSPAAL